MKKFVAKDLDWLLSMEKIQIRGITFIDDILTFSDPSEPKSMGFLSKSNA